MATPQTVKFGLNTFAVPRSDAFVRKPDTKAWLRETRARRQLRIEERTVNGQEITPQHQRQQLLAKVEIAKRPQLIALLNQVVVRKFDMDRVFNDADPAAAMKDISKGVPVLSDIDMREKLKSAIRMASDDQLKKMSPHERREARPVKALIDAPSPTR